jgi:hypothetical protein
MKLTYNLLKDGLQYWPLRYNSLGLMCYHSCVRPPTLPLIEISTRVRNKIIRFEVFTAVTMNNDVYWDIITQFVPHRRHITSLLQNPDG